MKQSATCDIICGRGRAQTVPPVPWDFNLEIRMKDRRGEHECLSRVVGVEDVQFSSLTRDVEGGKQRVSFFF